MADHNFDVVILGGGSGGYAAALRSAQLGKSVAYTAAAFQPRLFCTRPKWPT